MPLWFRLTFPFNFQFFYFISNGFSGRPGGARNRAGTFEQKGDYGFGGVLKGTQGMLTTGFSKVHSESFFRCYFFAHSFTE
jgi:hypothetical protein